MWTAMKSTSATSFGCFNQTCQTSPVETGVFTRFFTWRINWIISSAVFSSRRIVSLPTITPLTLRFVRASSIAASISRLLRASSLSTQAPITAFRPCRRASAGTCSRPPVVE
jgi:hypothetical protein